jgi:hypothetical protein
VELPKDLKGLATRNGLDVRHASFHTDMDRLISGLKAEMGEATTASLKPTASTSAAAFWTAEIDRVSFGGATIALRNSNEVHILEVAAEELTLDGTEIATRRLSLQEHYAFGIREAKFDLIFTTGIFGKVKSIRLLENNTVIFEWNSGTPLKNQPVLSGGTDKANSR